MTTGGAEIQIDKGNFTQIHNRILEILAASKFTQHEFKCLLFLLRQTYGYQRKERAIALSEWAKNTGIDKRNVVKVLNGLVEQNVIIKKDGGPGRGNKSVWGFNKYYGLWANAPEKVYEHTPFVESEKVYADTPLKEEKVYEHTPEKVYVDTPSKEKRKQHAVGCDAFAKSFEHYVGRPIASPYESERIADWSDRVTLDGWNAALEKTVRVRPNSFWNYAETILRDYEQNGYHPNHNSPSEATVDLNWSQFT